MIILIEQRVQSHMNHMMVILRVGFVTIITYSSP